MQDVTPKSEASLELRIRQWIEDNPGRATAGERMLEQLHRIKTEFSGETAKRLEALVAETLERQLRIDETRRASLDAARRLSQSVQKLTESMSQILVGAKRAHSTAVGAAMSAMAVDAEAKRQASPLSFGPRDKKLMN